MHGQISRTVVWASGVMLERRATGCHVGQLQAFFTGLQITAPQ